MPPIFWFHISLDYSYTSLSQIVTLMDHILYTVRLHGFQVPFLPWKPLGFHGMDCHTAAFCQRSRMMYVYYGFKGSDRSISCLSLYQRSVCQIPTPNIVSYLSIDKQEDINVNDFPPIFTYIFTKYAKRKLSRNNANLLFGDIWRIAQIPARYWIWVPLFVILSRHFLGSKRKLTIYIE